MNNVFIKTGHGYETGEYGRCTAFDDYEIIVSQLDGNDAAARESRVFGGTSYASFQIKLGKAKFGRELYILMQHGGGREVWRIPSFYDGGELDTYILELPERMQYSLLFTIYKIASDARQRCSPARHG